MLVSMAPLPQRRTGLGQLSLPAVVPSVTVATILKQTRHGRGNALACRIAAVTGDIVARLGGDGPTHGSEETSTDGVLESSPLGARVLHETAHRHSCKR